MTISHTRHTAFLNKLAAGTAVMHSLMFEQLRPLILTKDGKYWWNGIPVVVSDAMPPGGWYLIPGVTE